MGWWSESGGRGAKREHTMKMILKRGPPMEWNFQSGEINCCGESVCGKRELRVGLEEALWSGVILHV